MNAKDFVYSLRRMCKYYDGEHCYKNVGDGEYKNVGVEEVESCPMLKYNCANIDDLSDESFNIVEQWTEQHPEEPKKTRQSEFLKLFPNAKMWTDDKFLKTCPKDLDSTRECSFLLCYDCCRKYWGEVIE